MEGGRGGGLWCQIASGEVVTCWFLGILLYGDGGGGVVLRRPSLWIVVQGVEGDGVVTFPAVECQQGWVGCGCRIQEAVHGALRSVFPEKVVFRAPLVVAPLHMPPPLEGCLGCWEFLEDVLVVLLGVHRWGEWLATVA